MATAPNKKRALESDAQPDPEPKRSKLERYESSSTNSALSSSYDSSSSESDAPSYTKTKSWNREGRLTDESDSEITTSSYSSSASSSSSEESQNESDEEDAESSGSNDPLPKNNDDEIVSIPHMQRPLKPPIRLMNDSTLRNRLSSFLPAMKAANEELQQEIAAGKMASAEVEHKEGEEPHGQYIEMDLGLGVLEEKRGDGTEPSSSESGDSSYGDEEDQENEGHHTSSKRKEKSVMGKLMGNKSKMKRPIIEEMP